MIVRDNMIEVEGLVNFFKKFGRISAEAGKKLVTNVLKNPGRALDNTANVASAEGNRNSKNILSTLPEVITFYKKERRLYLGKIV